MAKHQCIQFGVCPRADRNECFEVDSDFNCSRNPEDPDCRNKLEEFQEGGKKGLAIKIGIPVVLLAIGGGLYFAFSGPDEASVAPSTPPSKVDELLKEVWPSLK